MAGRFQEVDNDAIMSSLNKIRKDYRNRGINYLKKIIDTQSINYLNL